MVVDDDLVLPVLTAMYHRVRRILVGKTMGCETDVLVEVDVDAIMGRLCVWGLWTVDCGDADRIGN